jgi:hypothetical protein
LLIPLAFTPPQTLAAIIAGSGSTDLTVTALSQAIPYAWRPQVAPNQAYSGSRGLNRYRDSAHFEVSSQLIGQP